MTGRIDAQLGALASGQGSVVLVSGEFGMGKTALLEQAMRMASTRGIRVFCGAGDPATQAVPLAPLLEALMVPADAPVDQDRIRNLSLSADLRFWLMRDLEDSLQRSAGTAPMLIVIDDLQWADAVSLRFLTLLSRRSPEATEAVRRSVRRDRHDSINRTSVSSLEHDWTELTAAEIRVARLAALGESNRTIAEHLFLSPHTVDSHLRSIFDKIGIGSRVELAHLAAERASRAHSRPAA